MNDTTASNAPTDPAGTPRGPGLREVPTRRVVVGYDGSAQSTYAMTWAAQAALARSCPLVVVQARDTSITPVVAQAAAFGIAVPETTDDDDGDVRAACERLAAENPGLQVEHEVVDGNAAGHLVEATGPDTLVVIGSRGLSPMRAAVLGGVADQVVTYAQGPVAVVPHEPCDSHAAGPVVVGADDSPSSRGALAVAAGVATRTGARLELLRTIEAPVPTSPLDPLAGVPATPELLVDDLAAAHDSLVERVRGQVSGVDVAGVTTVGSAAASLVEKSKEASLLVLGSRGQGGFRGLLLGSTSRRVVGAAHCPVIVVPSERH